MNKLLNFLPLLALIIFILSVFNSFIFRGNVPIPADTIAGLYHPWRDFFSESYPSGVPFKNFLITDPVRQQFVWRNLAMEQLKKGVMPNWNPYSLIGTPLLANLQSAALYPLNILYFALDFTNVWSFQIFLQPLLGGLFMWLYLRGIRVHPLAQALGVISWIGSGFFVAWLEWNTVVQAALWFPLNLYFIDRIFLSGNKTLSAGILALSLGCSFLAGHLQIFLYIWLGTAGYFLARLWQTKKLQTLLLFLGANLLALLLTFPQWRPMLVLLSLGARSIDPLSWTKVDWFLPWQHLVQFIAPDYYGNPATLNYIGVWNYGEFVGYIGIIGLIFAVTGVFFRRDKKSLLFCLLLLFSLVFSLPNPLSKLPYFLSIPFISQIQPTRLMVLTDFSLAVLAALGLDYALKNKKKPVAVSLFLIFLFLLLTWSAAFFSKQPISVRNLYLPTTIFISAAVSIAASFQLKGKFKILAFIFLLAIAVFDLSRFTLKYESFSNRKYLFPQTATTRFLTEKSHEDIFRIASVDDRVFPPNFSDYYRMQTIDGYDSLILRNYLNYLAKNGSQTSINRILTPKDFENPAFDELNVRYILSLNDINSPTYRLAFREGLTRVYENLKVLPRARFSRTEGKATIISYLPSEVIIRTETPHEDKLTLADTYYPAWKGQIDNVPAEVFPEDGIFRGMIVPAGSHTVRFYIE